jgi:hypothetical protein
MTLNPNHWLIRRKAENGDFSAEVAEQLIQAGCPSKLAWRTYTVAVGRECSIAEALRFRFAGANARPHSGGNFPRVARSVPAAAPTKPATVSNEERMASWRATQARVKAEMKGGHQALTFQNRREA